MKALGGKGTWNFSGLGSEHKQKEVGELLANNNIDVVYSWSGILGKGEHWNKCCRLEVVWESSREEGVGVLVCECLVGEVE